MTGLVDKRVHKRKQEFDDQVVYHEHQLPAVAVWFKADVCLSNTDDAISATQESLRDRQPDPSPSGFIVSVLPSAGDEEAFGISCTWQWVRLVGVNNFVWYWMTSDRWSGVWVSRPPITAWMCCTLRSAAFVNVLL